MSEQGQKIFKIVVWLCITVFLLVGFGTSIYGIMNPPISEEEWQVMLSEEFNDTAKVGDAR